MNGMENAPAVMADGEGTIAGARAFAECNSTAERRAKRVPLMGQSGMQRNAARAEREKIAGGKERTERGAREKERERRRGRGGDDRG